MKQRSLTELNRPTPQQFAEQAKHPVAIVCDNLRSAHNVGAVFRTADGFAFQAIHLCGITVTPPNNDIHKSALGAEFTVPWQQWETTAECLHRLKTEGYHIVALEQTDTSVLLSEWHCDATRPVALVLGNEVKGISPEALALCDQAVEIPMAGTKHSFNVSVAAGILMWEIFQKMVSGK